MYFRTVAVDGVDIFYREAGEAGRPVVLLLHGFPSARHMFRDLIPELANGFHVIAPDLPGFGQSAQPPRQSFTYSFAYLAKEMARFSEVICLERFALYVFV